jgi:hypothetical protein
MAGLCTLANLKLVLMPTSYTDTTDDTTLQLYIDRFTDEVQEYCSRQFVVDTGSTDYYFDVDRKSRELYIPDGISTVTTVSYATTSQPASGGTYTAVTAANVLLRPLLTDRRQGFPADTIVISDVDITAAAFYPGYNTVKVNMIRGWPTVPPTIEGLAIAVITRRWQARRGGQADSVGASDFGGPLLRFMSAEERMALDRYVEPVVG